MAHPISYSRAVNHRTFFPARVPVHFRILVPLPLKVTFPSVTYEVSLQSVLAAGRHELVACNVKTGTWPTLSPVYHARDKLEQAVFQVGFPVRPTSIAEVIMRRLVREKRAEVVVAPARDVTASRPGSGQLLGECATRTPADKTAGSKPSI